MRNFSAIILILLSIPLQALDPGKKLDSFIYKFYDTSNGMPQNSAASFAQNSKGFMYIATQEGLVKFDGVEMTVFDISSRLHLPSDLIRGVIADQNDNVFVATDKGLRYYSSNGDLIEDFTGENKINNSDISYISLSDNSEFLYGIISGRGIFSIRTCDPANIAFYNPDNGKLPTKNINTVKAFSSTEVYATGRSGLFYLKGDKFLKIEGSEDSFTAMVKDRQGNIWATGTEGLYRIEKNRIISHIGTNKGLPFKYLSSLFIDSENSIWFGSSINGLGRYRSGHFDSIFETGGTKFRNILAITEDREKNIWIGTAIDGFAIIKDGGIVDSKLKDHLILGITQDINGNIWTNSLGQGAVKIAPDGQEKLINKTIGLDLYTILGDRKGRIWVSSRNRGIFISKDGNNFSEVDKFYSSSAPFPLNPSVFFEDSSGSIWTNDRDSRSKVFKFMNNKMIVYKLPVENAVVTDVVQSSKDIIIVSTKQNGIFIFDEITRRFIRINTFHSEFFVHNMFFDSKDRLWMSTHNNGIYIYTDGDIIKLNTANGLFENNVHAVIEDKRHNFWFTTNKGVFTVTSDQIRSFLSGDSAKVNSIVFNESDGMNSRECNGGVKPSILLTKEGMLWIPTIKGIVKIDPENIEKSIASPKFAFTWLIVDNKDRKRIYDNNTVNLSPETKSIEIHYSSPSFLNPGNILFDHSLNSEHSVKGSKRRFASFSNLEPGSYEFSIKSYRTGNKYTNYSQDRFFFNILKPFYLSERFKYGSAGIILLSILLIVLMTKRVTRRRREEMQTTINEKVFELQMLNKELNETTVKDPLTGLKNRNFFFEFEESDILSFIESKERSTHLLENRKDSYRKEAVYSILMLDVDHFKRINDLYGHISGDMIIVDLSKVLLKTVRLDDTVIRWAGGKFLILLKNINREKTTEVAEKIRKNIEKTAFHNESGNPVWLTVSIGISYIPFFDHAPNLLNLDNVISIADLALRSSKDKGRDRITVVSAGKNIPSSKEELMGMMTSAQYSELNGFYTFEKITSDNYEEFDIEEVE